MNRSEFRARVANGFLLDGATGSNLMAAGKPRGIPSEDWVLENPHALHALQRAYVEAGSDIVYAPTFTATRAYRDDDVVTLNRRLVEICREGVGDSCLIGGDVTTVTRPDYEYAEMLDIYREQIEALCEAGCDAIVIETMMALPETMAALEAARKARFTESRSLRMKSGFLHHMSRKGDAVFVAPLTHSVSKGACK